MAHKILFVDDEKNILSSIKRSFLDDANEFLTAGSGAEGLEILKNTDVSVIISDMRMPEMDGAEFLKEANKIRPDATRMVLSGYADRVSIMDAINQGEIWRYITKPWDDNDLKIAVKNAIEFYVDRIKIKSLLSKLEEKNKQLENINKNLELEVQKRTFEIEKRSKLLDMMMGDLSINDIMNEACQIIAKITKATETYIYSPILDSIAKNTNLEIPASIEIFGKKIIQHGKVINEDQYSLGIPLLKGETILAALIIKNSQIDDEEKILKKVEKFSNLISLALFNHKTINEAPSVLDNLDKIIGDIDA